MGVPKRDPGGDRPRVVAVGLSEEAQQVGLLHLDPVGEEDPGSLEIGELNLKSQIAGSLKITFLLFQKLSRLFSIVSLAGKYCPPRGC